MAEILYESNYYGVSSLGDSLEHHGIKGMKWGVRRFQNPDGSLTAAGKQRYSVKMARKYHLFEEHPNKDQAWDNARYIKDAGGRHSEIKKYLRENKLPVKEWEEQNGYGRRLRDDIKARREKKAAAARENAFKKGNTAWAAKHVDELSTQELNEIVNRANVMKRLNDLNKSDRKSTLARIQGTIDTVTSFKNSIANAKESTNRLRKAFEKKEPEKSALEKLYDKSFEDATKAAVNKARKNTDGSLADKEFAAYMTLKSMENSRKEAQKKTAEIERAREKAEAVQRRKDYMDFTAVKDPEKRQEELERIRKRAGGRMWL